MLFGILNTEYRYRYYKKYMVKTDLDVYDPVAVSAVFYVVSAPGPMCLILFTILIGNV